jgi:hypothetical protein
MGISYLPMPLAAGQVEVLHEGGAGALTDSSTADLLWWAWVVLYAAAHALAFGFVWWAKPVFLVTFAVAIVSSAINGLLVSEPWSNTLWAIHNMAATFAIGMLFFSPGVRQRMHADLVRSLNKPPDESLPTTPVAFPPDCP